MNTELIRPVLPLLMITGSIVFGAQSLLYGTIEEHARSQQAKAEAMQSEIDVATQDVTTSGTPPIPTLVRQTWDLHETFNSDNPLAIHEHIMTRAAMHSIEVESIEPSRSRSKINEEDSEISVRAYEIRCVGEFSSLIRFFGALERESPWMMVIDWSLVPFPQEGRPTVRCTLRFERFTLDTTPLTTMAQSLEDN
ncbi:MAG: hypothetical protein ACF8GE_09825 [Phycisphaerales bacterium JB043]